ncbi:MAG TPA: hypothetical protein VK894_02190 [Jiangellales bacterium]|nr:hypothetical protein [Jiangellales bacterium]
MRRTALVAAVPIAAAGLLALAPAAHADHVHFRVTGSGQCVLLAPDGNEKYVQLPNADGFPENRRHPLHTQVHLGRPGEVGQVYVAYTADGTLTSDATELCEDGFLNR